ncbi:signal recognition particle subunit srp68 [Elasticomyces elasticus]|uniref:Signal recognition particle subunit SRP68 n=1 Tax=Exophiala sideris TaxID=1016849 RepID=A0ABR0JPQ3_9EURO|nr:signal recognition particle subunit srp68 [Elasticomyces elasticus]KAK5039510.1 signal recognition particle subunit srp68 [Exophiala sideris]KAK5041063.1 signal recognition particle subunit srp68 [Exophiala sideris]KAK5067887.1 signal recognition particle subunit srp68 [Exophiala sideris]KAK5187189.1 signal recognition particle subunit srp68 [Eurotiomycetes sp. CCFEE 6388]
MNITSSIVSERDRALLGGDYDTYHSQASRKIHNLRKRLGATNRGRKYTPKAPVTAESVAKNAEWIQLLLASSERAWASAMAMKSAQSAENTQKPMPGSTKRQIASRLKRAIAYADNLVTILQDRSTTGATEIDDLEARAYHFMLRGSLDFEKARWQPCVDDYSVAHIVYTALARTSKTEVFKELLSGIVEPSIRYAAYQLKMPRTKAINEIAIEHFPSSETTLRQQVEKIDPQAFVQATNAAATSTGPKEVPSTISWRSRKVKLEDANISQALGSSKEREDELATAFESFQQGSLGEKDVATAYEDVIEASQDAADATKTAIDELAAEGVDPGDARMQSLQITRTAVNYAVIEWRIGRNRVLCGHDDGLLFESEKPRQPLKPRKDGKPRAVKEESVGRKIARFRERVALYDSILQSLDAVKELPGVIADTAFVAELDAKRAYFRALKCLAIGRSHAINDQIVNALALYARALGLVQTASSTFEPSDATAAHPPKLDVSAEDLTRATSTLTKLVTQYRALADLKALTGSQSQKTTQAPNTIQVPLIERLNRNEYIENVDLTNLVNYPPKLRPVPVKPLFFDLAWNYIVYPSQKKDGDASVNGKAEEEQKQKQDEPQKQTKKGWFGFGR